MQRRYDLWHSFSLIPLCIALTGCGGAPVKPASPGKATSAVPRNASGASFHLDHPDDANDIVLYALSLLNTGYRFGGSNPEAGLDCSGMVSYVVEKVSGKRLPHNAAQIAAITQEINRDQLQPGDLVFFNTTGAAYSHMGIYLGDGRFVHAPSTRGVVRVERLDLPYFASRFTGARTLF